MKILASIVACLIVVGIIFFTQRTPEPQKELVTNQNVEAQAEARERYYNERYGFSFAQPDGVLVHEIKEGPRSVTIRVENVKVGDGFQIFITPYTEEVISEERFRMDIPSGVRQAEEMIDLDGIPAVAFLSEDARLGRTREIWFIRDGYLYEVTSLLEGELWLNSVLLTWEFENISN